MSLSYFELLCSVNPHEAALGGRLSEMGRWEIGYRISEMGRWDVGYGRWDVGYGRWDDGEVGLFDGDGLCEVAWFVNVTAFGGGNVVTEQLKGDGGEHGHEDGVSRRDADQVVH